MPSLIIESARKEIRLGGRLSATTRVVPGVYWAAVDAGDSCPLNLYEPRISSSIPQRKLVIEDDLQLANKFDTTLRGLLQAGKSLCVPFANRTPLEPNGPGIAFSMEVDAVTTYTTLFGSFSGPRSPGKRTGEILINGQNAGSADIWDTTTGDGLRGVVMSDSYHLDMLIASALASGDICEMEFR